MSAFVSLPKISAGGECVSAKPTTIKIRGLGALTVEDVVCSGCLFNFEHVRTRPTFERHAGAWWLRMRDGVQAI